MKNKKWKNKKKGFSLMELIIGVTILIMISGLTLVYMNKFNDGQAQLSAKNQISANLRLARNLAKTLQRPDGMTGALSYVEVQIDGATNEIQVLGVSIDSSQSLPYFTKKIEAAGVQISDVASGEILFAAYEGKLVSRSGSTVTPLPAGESRQVLIGSGDFSNPGNVIRIESSGLLQDSETTEVTVNDFMAVAATATLVPATSTPVPTVRPSATPVPTGVVITNCTTCTGMYSTSSIACTAANCIYPYECISNTALCGNNANCYQASCILVPTIALPTQTPVPTSVGTVTACSDCGFSDRSTTVCFGVYCSGLATCQALRVTCGSNTNCYRGACIDGSTI